MKKNAFIIFIVLTILITPFFVSTFLPNTPPSGYDPDPSGMRAYGVAIQQFINEVIRWLFGIFLFITGFLALAIYGRKNP